MTSFEMNPVPVVRLNTTGEPTSAENIQKAAKACARQDGNWPSSSSYYTPVFAGTDIGNNNQSAYECLPANVAPKAAIKIQE